MIDLRLSEIAAVVGGRTIGDAQQVVSDVTTDSRAIDEGGRSSLFVALRGEHADGHAFVGDAIDRGAVALLVERDPDEPSLPSVIVDDTWQALRSLAAHVRSRVGPTTVAITGSVGKTTVKDLTAAAVGAGRRTHAARGSYNNELGVPLTLLGIRDDTEVLVTEIGARHLGDIADLAPTVAPDLSVVTAVAPVHLEVFGTIEDIARAKGELVEALGPGGVAILNVADPRVAAMAEHAPSTLGVAADLPAADLHARDVTLDRRARARATAVTPWGEVTLRLPVAGRHHVTNALFALAVAGHLGVDLTAAAEALAEASVSPWRGEVLDLAGVCVVNDAYNANPMAMRAALDTLVAVEGSGRRWAVLGVMAEIGATAADEHRAVGMTAAQLGVDRLVVVGTDAAAIADGARQAGMTEDVVEVVEDATAASALLRAELTEGDVVLVKASRVAGLERVAADLASAAAEEVGS